MSAVAQLNLKPKVVSSTTDPVFIDAIEFTPTATKAEIVTTEEKKVPEQTISSTSPVTTSSNIEACSALQFKYAILLDVNVEEITNAPLLQFIEEWWGTRYAYGGSTKDGIDCSAFSGTLVSTLYNISLPRTAREQYEACEKIATEELKEGDLVFFNTRGGVSHVGVYLRNNCFVHSSTTGGVMISSLTEDYYAKRFVGAGRYMY